MLGFIKRKFKEFGLPKDPNFSHRQVATYKLGKLLIVELGANDYVLIHDMLAKIQLDDTEQANKIKEIMGLRYMALAMSLRCKNGGIPFDWQNAEHLLHLATLPHSSVLPALDAIVEVSGIAWLSPTYELQQAKEQNSQEVEPPSKDALTKNPS